ncbi:MAG: methyl-accepting chemotaxis protein [Kangiellaceae bacterium]|nr:methyl-accepting chemotaxis protein [Kangiellaceae bacterium]
MSTLQKLVLPLFLSFFFGCLAVYFIVPDLLTDRTIRSVAEEAQSKVALLKKLRKYYTNNVVNPVLNSSAITPNIEHKGDALTIPLPATMIHDLSEQMKSDGFIFELYSAFPFPNRQNRRLDPFESRAWRKLAANPNQPLIETETSEGRTTIRVAIADKMVSEACVSCHNNHLDTPKSDWKLGDVRGVLEVKTDVTDALTAWQEVNNTILTILIVTMAVMLILFILSYQLIVRTRLKKFALTMNKIADKSGDLTAHFDVTSNDEIGQIQLAFNHFSNKLRVTISDVLKSTARLIPMSQELSDITGNMVQKSCLQTNHSAKVIDSLEKAGNSSNCVAQHVQSINKASMTSRNSIATGVDTVNKTSEQINQLSRQLENSTQIFSDFKASSDSIVGVIDVIKSIADQTNLLALNAAIEAARAGEQGRGFSVVADEVRALASKTHHATEEVQELVNKMQIGTNNASDAIKDGMIAAVDSVAQVAKSKIEFQNIHTDVENIIELVAEITQSISTEQDEFEKTRFEVETMNELLQSTLAMTSDNAIGGKDLENLGQKIRQQAQFFNVGDESWNEARRAEVRSDKAGDGTDKNTGISAETMDGELLFTSSKEDKDKENEIELF